MLRSFRPSWKAQMRRTAGKVVKFATSKPEKPGADRRIGT
jgi:hypothetical protein